MDTCECGTLPNGPVWGGQRWWVRRLGWMTFSIGFAILAGGPAMAESQDRVQHDAGRTPERHGISERHDKDCKKSQNCPTAVRQIGPLDSIIADDIMQQVNVVPFTAGHHTPILLQGKMLSGLRKREKKSLKRTYRAGHTIVLLDATMEHVAALHGIIKDGVISSSKDGEGVLAYSLRQENHIPTAILLSNVHRSPLRTALGEPDPTGLQDEEQARKRAAALTVRELGQRPMRPSQDDPDPSDLKDEEQEHERATDRASDVGRWPNVRMLPQDPNQPVNWQSSPVQKTVFLVPGAVVFLRTRQGDFTAEYQRRWFDSLKPEVSSEPEGQKYGYGISRLSWGPNTIYFHGCETPGCNSKIRYDLPTT